MSTDNIQELLKPRQKVIADYPGNEDFPVGKIIEFEPWNTFYWQHSVKDCQGERTWLLEFFDKYPHLFQKLQWWQDREEVELPRYLKANHVGFIENGIYAVEKYSGKGGIVDHVRLTNGAPGYLGWFLPTTEIEYTNYINKK